MLVAWDARGTIRTRFRRSMTTPFGSAETIRSEETFFAQLHAAVGSSGRAYLAWSAKFISEGGAQHEVFYEVAVRPSGQRFRQATLLERQPATRPQNPIGIAVTRPRRDRRLVGLRRDQRTRARGVDRQRRRASARRRTSRRPARMRPSPT